MLLDCVLHKTVIPLSLIQSIRIRESINSQIIEGDITFLATDYINYNEIRNNKVYAITFIVFDIVNDQDHILSFLVDGINDATVQVDNNVTITFSSWFSPDLYTRPNSVYYNNLTYSEMLIKLLKTIKVETNYVVESNGEYDITLPNWSIYTSNNYILNRMCDKNNRAGYLMFPDLLTQKMNIVNYNNLYNGNIQNYTIPLLKNVYGEVDEYIGQVSSILIPDDYSLLGYLENGLGKTNLETFNLDNGQVEKTDNTILDVLNTENASYKKIILNNEYINNTYAKKEYVPFEDKDTLIIQLNNKYYNLLNEMNVVNIEINGDYNRKVGAVVILYNYKYDESGLTTDDKLSSVYVISDIEHIISDKSYIQNINLIKSGSSIEDNK